ncbi:hypothetical protein EVAR_100744_1 [Eumeta japonica]|uniref:Uncharacterized protein n=1 Tax=Eumeta variegata TaxID=151549 RepID=A0A4C1ZCY7_EUMVA|nr:hypothetical protein EVAR_100744_1 [Eumeta japonica]
MEVFERDNIEQVACRMSKNTCRVRKYRSGNAGVRPGERERKYKKERQRRTRKGIEIGNGIKIEIGIIESESGRARSDRRHRSVAERALRQRNLSPIPLCGNRDFTEKVQTEKRPKIEGGKVRYVTAIAIVPIDYMFH